jgi:hypothetical protein
VSGVVLQHGDEIAARREQALVFFDLAFERIY